MQCAKNNNFWSAVVIQRECANGSQQQQLMTDLQQRSTAHYYFNSSSKENNYMPSIQDMNYERFHYINVSLADFVSFCFYSATVIHSGTEEKRRKRRKNHRHHHCNKPFLFSAAVTIPVHYRNLRLRLLKIHGNLFKQTNLKAEDVTIMHPNNSLATHNNLTSKWRLAPPLTPTCCRPQNRFWNWLLYHEQWPHFAGNEELSIDLSFSVSSQGRQGGTDISLWLAYQGKVWIIMS